MTQTYSMTISASISITQQTYDPKIHLNYLVMDQLKHILHGPKMIMTFLIFDNAQ
jgi:hypothetical protein